MRFDVFLSYAHPDAPWVRVLAGRLDAAGLKVFLDEWSITPGDVLVHSLDEGIRHASAGVLVCSPHAMASAWVREEYAALLTEGRRLVPVIYRDVELPPLVAARVPVDFRHAEGPAYDAAVAALIRALRAPLPVPPPAGFRAEGPCRAGLTITTGTVTLTDTDRHTEITASPGDDAGLRSRLLDLDRVRRRHGDQVTREPAPAAAADLPVQESLRQVGALLGEIFTPGPVGAELVRLTAAAHGQHAALRLRTAADDALADLPWETLIPPGGATSLCLDPTVQLYRTVPHAGPVPSIHVPAPLRVLVVLASPEGPLLDVEKELATILDAVEPARKEARAHVRVLNTGTLAAIREALTAQRFHVLHISCHATPHELLLEDDDGRPDRVTAARLVAAIPNGRSPAAVVLAGCSTALSPAALPGLARELLAAGIPQVLAMTAPVTDRYAAIFGGRLYRELALAERPSMVTAVANARRQVEEDRRALPPGDPRAALVEWATPALFVTGEPADLYDPAGPMEQLTEPAPPVLAAGVPLRPIGDFVGRRPELRLLSAALRGAGHPGVLVHGIGGGGKSSLVAELLRLLGDQAGLVVSLVGVATTDLILESFGKALFTAALRAGHPDPEADRRLAAVLRSPDIPWRERLEAALTVLAERPVTLLLDNFESNLDPRPDGTGAVRDDVLSDFLAVWIRTPGDHRLVVTSRYPFALPGNVQRRLTTHHLGPLSLAETRKLIWRLPGLDALTPAQQVRAWTDVGGHPRTLEYLDALLRHGRARFADVTERLEALLATSGIDQPGTWVAGHDRPDFERTLAEAVTLTVNDALLDQLVALLDTTTRELLVRAAVHRRPAGLLALAGQTGDEGVLAPLTGLGLLSPVSDPDRGERQWVVHRWTASALARLHPEGTRNAHRRAAAYYVHRVEQPPDGAAADIRDLVDARHHYHAAGDLENAVSLSVELCGQLSRWSAWDWEAAVSRETLTWLPERSFYAGAFAHRLAIIAQLRGDYAAAERLFRECLAIAEELQDQAALASTYFHLGVLARYAENRAEADRLLRRALTISEDLADTTRVAKIIHEIGLLAEQRGDADEAERLFRQALAVREELGDPAGIAIGVYQLSRMANHRGDDAEAERLCRQSLAMAKRLGDRAGIARSLHLLGTLASRHGDYTEAEQHFHQALTIFEEIGDRSGVAHCFSGLSDFALKVGDHAEARRRNHQGLTAFAELGDRSGVAHQLSQQGRIHAATGELAEAVRVHITALAMRVELELPTARIDLLAARKLRAELGPDAFREAVATLPTDGVFGQILGVLAETPGQ